MLDGFAADHAGHGGVVLAAISAPSPLLPPSRLNLGRVVRPRA